MTTYEDESVCSWRRDISKTLRLNGESWEDVESCTLTKEELDLDIDSSGDSGRPGLPFTLWTKRYVYFPAVYDGVVWVAFVSRNPDGVSTEHVGGS